VEKSRQVFPERDEFIGSAGTVQSGFFLFVEVMRSRMCKSTTALRPASWHHFKLFFKKFEGLCIAFTGFVPQLFFIDWQPDMIEPAARIYSMSFRVKKAARF